MSTVHLGDAYLDFLASFCFFLQCWDTSKLIQADQLAHASILYIYINLYIMLYQYHVVIYPSRSVDPGGVSTQERLDLDRDGFLSTAELHQLGLSEPVALEVPLGNTMSYLELGYHQLMGSIWIYLDLFGSIWIYLDLFGSIWIYLDQFGSIWIYLDQFKCKLHQ